MDWAGQVAWKGGYKKCRLNFASETSWLDPYIYRLGDRYLFDD